MEGKTHIIGGAAFGLAFAAYTGHDPILATGAGALGGIIPDICHTGSKIGKKLPALSFIVSKVFGHRTFTHSLGFLVLTAWLMSTLPIHSSIQWGIIVGMFSHMLLDACTKNGIKFLYPLPINFRSPLAIRTGGPWEKVYTVGLWLLFAYSVYKITGGV